MVLHRTLEQIMSVRREKLKEIRGMGLNPFPYKFNRTHSNLQIKKDFHDLKEGHVPVSVAGRITSIRIMGRASFANIQDSSDKIQIYIKSDDVGEQLYNLFKLLDIGDIIGVKGTVFQTRTGEITVKADRLVLLSKNLRPLPVVKEKMESGEKVVYDQFSDVEQRYRQRYVDLIVNSETREIFVKRSRIISRLRKFLDDRGFLEVETPILQPVYGGATARPFVTHHNTLDMDLYLRIANELYLKRLIIGGYERVYEFSKDFRNEGMDRLHNPEFTMLELYAAYWDYNDLMDFVEEMIGALVKDINGSVRVSYQGHEIDFSSPWPRIEFFEILERTLGYDISEKSEDELRSIAGGLGVKIDLSFGRGKIIDKIFSEKVEPALIQPTFIKDYPLEISPLAKRHRNNPTLAERFEPFIAGSEIGNAFSELNDPLDQRERFAMQAELRKKGDDEALVMDEDFLMALEYGMPPTAGLGVGIDRLVMILTDSSSIRDVIFFPQMRPREIAGEGGNSS
ncbi:MAG: lysine--tRNA ligase [Fidelibacterota bacterium]